MVVEAALATVLALAAGASGGPPANGACDAPGPASHGGKLECVRASAVLLDQPTLTLEQLVKGPDFDPADPERSRFAYFTLEDTLNCYFRPFFAFIGNKGLSPKFLCWQLAGPGAFFDRAGQKVDVADAKVVTGGRGHSALFARADASDAHEIEADVVKVKYLVPPFPRHDRRDNEVFTEVAASRFMWALGFPSDRQYMARAVNCIGCSADPFQSNQKVNRASLHDAPVAFKVISIERLLAWDAIDPEDDTWSWSDAAAMYSSGWTREQQVGFDAYRLALGLITYHNPRNTQNRLVCAQWAAGAGLPRVCERPVILVQDLGGTFGKPGGMGMNPRGDFGAWKSQRVFADAGRCELAHPLRGAPSVVREAQELILGRLEHLDRERVKAIFSASGFHLMDQKQLARLRHESAANAEDAALEEWTDVFMRHAAEIRSARNCRP